MFLGKTQLDELLIELNLNLHQFDNVKDIIEDLKEKGGDSKYLSGTDPDNQQICIEINEDVYIYSQQTAMFYDYNKDIWECRKRFRTLPDEIKNAVIEHWSKSMVPKEPFRFLSLIHRWQVDPLHFEREKGNASKYIKTIITDGTLKIIEISKDEYWSNLTRIDSKG